jgi:hypothetical protein
MQLYWSVAYAEAVSKAGVEFEHVPSEELWSVPVMCLIRPSVEHFADEYQTPQKSRAGFDAPYGLLRPLLSIL